ncbi:adenosine kinase [Synechocystis sp. LKSZ1]|uniref:adenosine kinase n=1 Tax=Synechocystis sp. LKSZ1 TaxID=3144951 RepID=UPI00336BEB5B
MSRRYHVYGIGNALVDMEFTVTPEQLEALGIDKGVMTLVDEQRENELIAQLQSQRCKQSGGGSAANTMVALAQLGGKGFYSCKVAQDEAGTFYLADLQACGLTTNLHNGDRQPGITGKCLVLITPDADRTMNTFLGITAHLSTAELVPEALQDSDYLYIEGYLVTSPTAKACAIEAKALAEAAGVKTSLSLSDPNMTTYFKEGLLEMIGSGVDLLFANESEAMTLAGTPDSNETLAYCKTLAKSFAITKGSQGSVIFDGEKFLEIPTTPVQAIDTVGAGDMYAGGLLYGLTQGWDYGQAATLASRLAAKVVTCYGPRLEPSVIQAITTEVLQDRG